MAYTPIAPLTAVELLTRTLQREPKTPSDPTTKAVTRKGRVAVVALPVAFTVMLETVSPPDAVAAVATKSTFKANISH
jgi:peroxiredoxin